jgi:hypothetical protein
MVSMTLHCRPRRRSPLQGNLGSVVQCCELRLYPSAVRLVAAFPGAIAKIAGWIVGCVQTSTSCFLWLRPRWALGLFGNHPRRRRQHRYDAGGIHA